MKQVIYHVFTDRRDYYTEQYRLARKVFDHYAKTMGCARLFILRNAEDEITEEADCLMAHGPYPI